VSLIVVAQEFDSEKLEWVTTDSMGTYSVDDEDEAKKEAAEAAAETLNALVETYEQTAGNPDIPLPWRDRILVCPLLDDGSPEVGAKKFCITIEIE
jgi:hypothetical protein